MGAEIRVLKKRIADLQHHDSAAAEVNMPNPCDSDNDGSESHEKSVTLKRSLLLLSRRPRASSPRANVRALISRMVIMATVTAVASPESVLPWATSRRGSPMTSYLSSSNQPMLSYKLYI